jgi:predicted TIM-barrel fold metal-dependent hydrolase
MTDTRVIDMWAPFLPLPEVGAHLAEHFPEPMLGYLRVFWKQPATMETVRAMQAGRALDEDVVMRSLDEAGIERSLITGFDETTSAGSMTMPNELVAKIAERHPGRFIPFCGVDIFKGMDAVREMEHWIRGRGFAGLSLRPFMIDLPADDRHYYPFYAKCVELGVPLSIHTSANWTTGRVNELGHPRYLDTVATHFPELVIVMSHAGYPWILDACLMAWKHENVYLELAAHRPKYMARPGTGWEPLLTYGTTTIRHKVLYGSGWFLMGRPPAELIGELRELPVPEDVLDDWLYHNAARLFGLGSADR